MAQPEVIIRDSVDSDIARISEIYGRSVLEDTASFELTPPETDEIARRRQARLDGGLPDLVAEANGRVVGYAYAGLFNTRPAYGFTVENTVYVDPRAQRGGVGRMLLKRLIEECTARGYRQMIAVISGSERVASIELHRSLGFTDAGTNKSVGYKHGRWIDTVHLQLALGDGDTTPPDKVRGS